VGVGRWHLVAEVRGGDAPEEFGLVGFAGDDREGALGIVEWGVGAIGDIETEVGFPVVGVGAVAFEALIREDGADVEVKADLFRGVGVGAGV
jgi:hypothetical protein